MSGGGSKKKKEEEVTPSEPMPTRTVQPFVGDNQNMLAQQLAAGGYGDIASILASFAQTYAPMNVPDYSPQPVPDPAATPTPTPTAPAPRAPSIGNRRKYEMGGSR